MSQRRQRLADVHVLNDQILKLAAAAAALRTHSVGSLHISSRITLRSLHLFSFDVYDTDMIYASVLAK